MQHGVRTKKKVAILTDFATMLVPLLLCSVPWIIVRLHISTFTSPVNSPCHWSALSVTAIDSPILSLLSLLLLIPLLTLKRLRYVLAVPGGLLLLVLGSCNYANMVMAQEYHRQISLSDIVRSMRGSFITGSLMPELFSWAALGLVFIPCMLYGVLLSKSMQWRLTITLRQWMTIVFIIGCSTVAVRKWGYSLPLSRHYASAQSLYFHTLFSNSERVRILNEKEVQEMLTLKTVLESSRCAAEPITLDADGKRPNIILVVLESFSAAYYEKSLHGITIAKNMQRIANAGRRYPRCYSNSYVTSRALWSIFTGELDTRNGFTFLDNPTYPHGFISDSLALRGYNNYWFHGNDNSYDNRGDIFFRHHFTHLFGREAYPPPFEKVSWGIGDIDFATTTVAKLDSIEDADTTPFLSTILFMSNHHPYEMPEKWHLFDTLTGVQNAAFFNGLHYSDAALGVLWDSLKTKPWMENTYLIITADNGVKPESQFTDHQEEVAAFFTVPLIVVGPGIAANSIDLRLACHVDIGATILALGGVDTVMNLGCSVLSAQQRTLVPIVGTSFGTIIVTPDELVFANRHGIYDSYPADIANDTRLMTHILSRYHYLWDQALRGGMKVTHEDLPVTMRSPGTANTAGANEYPQPPVIIAHALGAAGAKMLTNAREALLASRLRGIDYFEVDLSLTKDSILVASHSPLSNLTAQAYLERGRADSLTYLTYDSLIMFLQRDRKVVLILDCKDDFKLLLQRVVAQTSARDPNLLARIIPQVYSTDAIKELEKSGKFGKIILTLYKTDASDDAVLQAINSSRTVWGVTMSQERFSEYLAEGVARAHVKVFVHTVNNQQDAAWYHLLSVDGVYSDLLPCR